MAWCGYCKTRGHSIDDCVEVPDEVELRVPRVGRRARRLNPSAKGLPPKRKLPRSLTDPLDEMFGR